MYSDFEMDTSDLHMSESIGKGEIIPKTSWQSPEIIFEFDGIIFSKKDLLLAGKNQTLIKFVPQSWNNGLLETSGTISEVDKVKSKVVEVCGKNRHLMKSCPVCCKSMRSDTLKRHLKRHDVSAKTWC